MTVKPEPISSRPPADDAVVTCAWQWDLVTNQLDYSPGLGEVFGRDDDGFEPTAGWRDSQMHPDDRARTAVLWDAHTQGKTPFYECDYRVHTGDGGWQWVRDKGRIVARDADGRPRSATGEVRRLVTSPWATAPRAEEDRYRFLVDNTIEAIFVVQDSVFKYVNPATCSGTGFSEEEMLGQEVMRFVHPGDAPLVVDHHLRRERGEEYASIYNYRSVDREGNVRWMEMRAVAITWEGRPATLCLVFDVHDRILLEEKLKHLAAVDSLTGLLNRREYFRRTEREIARSRRYGSPLSIVLTDIDDFKRINDTLGHAAGDEAIKLVAAASGRQLRESDIFGRIGGEEFAMTLLECDLETAGSVAERIRGQVAGADLSSIGPGARLTVSVGVAQLGPDDDGLSSLLNRADRAMYAAKESGKDRVVPDGSGSSAP